MEQGYSPRECFSRCACRWHVCREVVSKCVVCVCGWGSHPPNVVKPRVSQGLPAADALGGLEAQHLGQEVEPQGVETRHHLQQYSERHSISRAAMAISRRCEADSGLWAGSDPSTKPAETKNTTAAATTAGPAHTHTHLCEVSGAPLREVRLPVGQRADSRPLLVAGGAQDLEDGQQLADLQQDGQRHRNT